ncbi:CD225/dispanin family protein [Prevotella melaninogenica]|uniref:CD225/dispanin family protein n=1 Tax=Prevotella melaninogenica TaxID=28132 RepID=UPI001BAAD927|nr:CD225/dispanin family protein [Prevotella melaninogenica]QUB64957.1 CD225/dispanin family protein [Prevotella melaninogenica]
MEEMNTPKPNNYLALAIFTTVCCCLPAGIYAIIRAMKVNELYMMKQYEEATLAANDAKKWSIIGIVVGAIVSILYLVFYGGLAALGAMAGAQ